MRISDWSSDVCSSDLGDGERAVEQFGVGHDLGDEAIFLGGLRVEAVAGQEQFGGARIAEHALEQPRPAVAGDDADLDEAARELRALGGDADITGAGEVAAEADCMAVDRGDHRDLAVHQRADHRLNAAAIVGAGRIGLVEHADALAIQHRFQIAAGAERLAAAGQDDSADPAILAERAQRVDDVVAVGVRADRVHAFGLAHRQDCDLAAPLDTQKFTHARSEEHTSELQSLMRISYAVFCLKKKKTQRNNKVAQTNKNHIQIKPSHNSKHNNSRQLFIQHMYAHYEQQTNIAYR